MRFPCPRPARLLLFGILAAACIRGTSRAQEPPAQPSPIAIVPLNTSDTVSGAILVTAGTASIQTNGSITSGSEITPVVLPRRGMLRVCPSTTVNLAADTSVPAGETPGLMMALRPRRHRGQLRRRPQLRCPPHPRFPHPHRRARRGRCKSSPRGPRRHLRG